MLLGNRTSASTVNESVKNDESVAVSSMTPPCPPPLLMKRTAPSIDDDAVFAMGSNTRNASGMPFVT